MISCRFRCRVCLKTIERVTAFACSSVFAGQEVAGDVMRRFISRAVSYLHFDVAFVALIVVILLLLEATTLLILPHDALVSEASPWLPS